VSISTQQAIGLSILGGALYASYAMNKPVAPQKTSENLFPSRNNQNYTDRDNAPDANLIIFSSEEDSKKAIGDINNVRKRSGLTPLNYSAKAYKLATARARDMNQYNYFDFTNPQTKSCTDNMKLEFGFTSQEFLAESNIRYVPIGANIGSANKSLSEVSKKWVEENTINDQNFLFPQHVAGAIGCDGNKCVFLALNYAGYGRGCGIKKR